MKLSNKVAIVTGATQGIGLACAERMIAEGAKVMLVDIKPEGAEAATKLGEQARFFAADVSQKADVDAMVAATLAAFGRIDILINNAGVLRDKTFAKMEPADFEFVVRVHLLGSAFATKACWETFREQNYGRVLMTASSTGLFGNFGQANYGAAKMGLVGLAKTLGIEGAKHDIRVNSIAPTAGTRMTEDLFPAAAFEAFAPERVAPGALYLVSEDAPSNVILGAGAGAFQASYVTLTSGALLTGDALSPEGVAAQWDAIVDRTGEIVPKAGAEQAMTIGKLLQG